MSCLMLHASIQAGPQGGQPMERVTGGSTTAESINSFKQGIDQFWANKPWLYDYETYNN